MANQAHYEQDKEALLLRLRKMEGQVRGIAQMIEDQRYCLDVIQQINALTAAAREVTLMLAEDHIQASLENAVGQPEEASIKEIMRVLRKAIRP